jgi:hypothetical protein
MLSKVTWFLLFFCLSPLFLFFSPLFLFMNLPHSSPKRYTQKVNYNKVLLHKPKLVCNKLSGACQVCFKMACDVTDFEAYASHLWPWEFFVSFPAAAVADADDAELLVSVDVSATPESFLLLHFRTFCFSAITMEFEEEEEPTRTLSVVS